ncbi:MAG TPA: CAP domain-containing protein [Hyphomicrobiales bacterium]|nr:CAP domain-containing protein [Hyphomicrobiales bacterium]
MRRGTGGVLLLCAAFFLAVCLLSRPVLAQETVSQDLRELALKLVNNERTSRQLNPLKLGPKLTEAAQSHADDMLRRKYYSHYSPEGKSIGDRFKAAGGDPWLLTAENIAKCEGCKPPIDEAYVRQMHEGWMNSPGHRANILRKGLTEFGYGLVIGQGKILYAVQTFSGPGTPQGDDAAADARALSPQEQLEIALGEINRKRQTNGRSALRPSPALSQAARNMLPESGDSEFKVRQSGDIYDAVPPESQNDWAQLTAVIASCGGCGTEPVRPDAVYFTGHWLGDSRYNEMLMQADATYFGFAMAANGKGKKIGVGLLGKEH